MANVAIENRTKATLGVVGICMLDPGVNSLDAETFNKLKAAKVDSAEGPVSYLRALLKEGKLALPERKAAAKPPEPKPDEGAADEGKSAEG